MHGPRQGSPIDLGRDRVEPVSQAAASEHGVVDTRPEPSSPPSSQIGQSWGWFGISHSATCLRKLVDSGSRVATAIPSSAGVMQAMTIRLFSSSVTVTAQTRHAPTASSSR
jgi:hypothetical protein